MLDFADFRALGEFLYRAPRFARSALVSSTLGGNASQLVDGELVEQLRIVVDNLLDELPFRQRTIVKRCDLRGEAREAVAADLGISLRHLFRERNEAQERIAEALARGERGATIQPTLRSENKGLEPHIRLSEVLNNSGQWRESAAVLNHLSHTVGYDEQRTVIHLRLSRVYATAQRFSLARHHGEIARALARRLEPSQRWREFAADTALARVSLFSGNIPDATQTLTTVVAQLRSHDNTTGSSLQETIAEALILRGTGELNSGLLESAQESAADALSTVRKTSRTDPRLEIAAQHFNAFIDILLKGDTEGGDQQLLRYHQQALDHGLLHEALRTANLMSIYYRLQRRPQAATVFLAPLWVAAVTIDDSIAASDYFAELAFAYMDTSKFEEAAHCLHEFERLIKDPGNRGFAEFLAARIHIGLGDFSTALVRAENAESAFVHTGDHRFLPSALLCQSEALSATEKNDDARRILPVAIDLAEKLNQPDTLAAAYSIMAKVSGQGKYARRALEIRRLRNKI